jgi:hypothetical protein
VTVKLTSGATCVTPLKCANSASGELLMNRANLVTLAVCAAALVACSKPAAQSSAASGVTAASAASATAAPAPAPAPAGPAAVGPAGPIDVKDLPAPAAGQWSRASSQDGAAAQTSTKCLSGKPIDPTEGGPACTKITAVRTATGGFVVDGDCPANGVSAKLHMAGEGNFKTSFTTDTTMSMSGGGGPAMSLSNHSVWTYVGACPAGD